MPAPLKEVLTAQRKRLIASQHPCLAMNLVFPSTNGKYRITTAIEKTLAQLSEVCGLSFRVTPQVLRRSFNTLLAEAGVSPIVPRAQMGHSSERMTERYAGVHLDRKAELVTLLVEMTKPKDGKTR